jgi:DNA-binding NtrC family response regulator
MSPFDATPTAPSPRGRALIVSSARKDRERFELLFAQQQILPLTADTAESAIGLLKVQPFDIVLCDITLRGRQEGLDVGRWSRQHQPQTSLILLSDSFPWIPASSSVAGVPILIRPLNWLAVAKKIAATLSSPNESQVSRAA